MTDRLGGEDRRSDLAFDEWPVSAVLPTLSHARTPARHQAWVRQKLSHNSIKSENY
jgi:hypothetical protein